MGVASSVPKPYYDSSVSNDMSPPMMRTPLEAALGYESKERGPETDDIQNPSSSAEHHHQSRVASTVNPHSLNVAYINRHPFEDYYFNKKIAHGTFSTIYRATRYRQTVLQKRKQSKYSSSSSSHREVRGRGRSDDSDDDEDDDDSDDRDEPPVESALPPPEKVAIKQVYIRHLNRPQYHDLLYEVNLLSQLSHPKIIELKAIYEPAALNSDLYMVFEYVKGGEILTTLANQETTAYTFYDIIYYFQQLLSAIHYLHGHFVVHRNIIPETIIFQNKYNPLHRKENRIKLIGFDYAKCLLQVDDRPLVRPVKEKMFCPPEQMMTANSKDTMKDPSMKLKDLGGMVSSVVGAKETEMKSFSSSSNNNKQQQQQQQFSGDIWNFASLLYFFLTGRLPYENNQELFQEPIWEKMPHQSKILFTQALTTNPLQRISSKDILLNHQNWFLREMSELVEGDIELGINMKELQLLQSQREFNRQLFERLSLNNTKNNNNNNPQQDSPGGSSPKAISASTTAPTTARFRDD